MRTAKHYIAFAVLTLGTFATFAATQNQGSNDTPRNRTVPSGSVRQPGTHITGQEGNRLQRGNAALPHAQVPRAQGPHAQLPQGGYTPGQHTVVVTRTPRGTRTEQRFAAGGRVVEATRSAPGGGTVHAVRYGNGVSGVVEHPLKPGYVSRTYVRGGRVTGARVYSQHSFTRFGRTFTYQSIVPAVAFSPAYYAWAVHPWPRAIAYQWGWDKQSWYAAYGDYFTPYSDYSSLDLWLTDYVIAENLRASYQNWQADTYPDTDPESGAAGEQSTAPPSSGSDPDSAGPSSEGTPSPEAAPPPITPEIKQGLNAQIKLRLRERQKTAAGSVASGPGALQAGHTLFRVNAQLDVPADTPGGVCSLGPDDYIERTGDMDSNGNVPVEVKLSAISDCGTGLVTRVSENDLEAMDSEQDQQLTQALLAASKNMGQKGLPKAPATTPLLLSAGQARADASAPRTLNQL